MVYYKNLNFLRFIAVSLVLFQHWLFQDFYIDMGKIGVTVFFVLSGFLITGILLRDKQEIENNKLTLRDALKNFYMRRSLRIFPIYFLLIGFLFFMNYKLVTENFWWFITYTSNIRTFVDQAWMSNLGPLWTLAVEEQFYFIWPALLFLVHNRHLKILFIVCLILGPLFRLGAMFMALHLFESVNLNISSIVLMPSNIDLFAMGGILAYNVRNSEQILRVPIKLTMVVSIILFILSMVFIDSMFYHVVFVWIIGVWSYFIILYLIDEKECLFTQFFQFKPFTFLGKISYGLYLYHGPFFFILAVLSFSEMKMIGNHFVFGTVIESQPYLFFRNISYLIMISTISWYVIEKPMNRFKRFFV